MIPSFKNTIKIKWQDRQFDSPIFLLIFLLQLEFWKKNYESNILLNRHRVSDPSKTKETFAFFPLQERPLREKRLSADAEVLLAWSVTAMQLSARVGNLHNFSFQKWRISQAFHKYIRCQKSRFQSYKVAGCEWNEVENKIWRWKMIKGIVIQVQIASEINSWKWNLITYTVVRWDNHEW